MTSLRQELVESYEGELERWKIDLALSRIVRFGFPEHEWHERMQDLAIEMVNFRYVPAKPDGASESTVLYSLVTNRLRDCLRRKYRREEKSESLDALIESRGEALEDSQRLRRRDVKPCVLDVRAAVAELPPKERAVCQGLLEGESIAEIARRLRCGWHTVNRTLARVRGRFEEMGLRGWIWG